LYNALDVLAILLFYTTLAYCCCTGNCWLSGRGRSEKVGRWTAGRAPTGGGGACPLPIYRGLGCYFQFFLNIGENLCNVVHFWLKIGLRILNNSMFNLDFGRSIRRHQVIKSGKENRRFSVPLLKVGREFTVPVVYRFRGPCAGFIAFQQAI